MYMIYREFLHLTGTMTKRIVYTLDVFGMGGFGDESYQTLRFVGSARHNESQTAIRHRKPSENQKET